MKKETLLTEPGGPLLTIGREGDREWVVSIIDGPNMSNLAARSDRVYGSLESIDALHDQLKGLGHMLGVRVETFVSNYEGAILEYIHSAAGRVDGFLVNPAGLTMTGEATRSALVDTGRPWIEVHFANIASATSPAAIAQWDGIFRSQFMRSATGVVMGFKRFSYVGALICLVLSLDNDAIEPQ